MCFCNFLLEVLLLNIKKALPIVLIIIGLILIALPMIGQIKLKDNIQRVSVEDISAEQLIENQSKVLHQEDFDFSKVKEISPTSSFINPDAIDKSHIIGQLVVPSINLNLTILKGTTDYNLLVGATTMKPSDTMGAGNYTLAGHFNKDKSVLFGGLMDVKIGDKIRITDKYKIYEYQVYDTKTVNDDALDMISDDVATKRGKPVISLMTCYFSSSTGKRYFVIGELVDTYPYNNEDMFK